MLQYIIPGLVLILAIVLHLYTFVRRSRYNHIPQPPLPLSWNWIRGHASLIIDEAKKNNFQTAAIFKSIGLDLGAETFALFVGFNNNSYWMISEEIDFISKIISDHRTFWKVGPKNNPLAFANGVRVLGDHGILLEPGTDVWYHKRKMMDPAFLKKNLKSLMDKMNQSSNKLCQHLREKHDQKIVDVYDVFMKVALEVVCTCGFNLEDDFITLTDSKVNNAVNDLFAGVMVAFFNRPTYWMPWKHQKEKKSLKSSADMLREKMKNHLQERYDAVAAGTDTHNDILSHIIRGNQYSDKLTMDDLVDDFLVFLIAGMETTAITMSIMIWFFLKNPDVARKAIDEVYEVYGDKEDLEFEDLGKLVYLEQCIKETLRIHPPVIMTTRKNHHRPETVNNIHIPTATRLIVPLETIQRSEKHWENPLKFDPDRFAPGKHNKPFTFFPFAAGPRICIGKHFSIMEAKMVISKVLKEFQLVDPYPEEKELEKIVVLTSRPKNGVFVKLIS